MVSETHNCTGTEYGEKNSMKAVNKKSSKKRELSIDTLVHEARREPTFENLCNKLHASPAAVRDLITRAKQAGYAVRIGAENIGIGHELQAEAKAIDVPPVVGDWFKIGVISDLHAGSKYVLKAQCVDCVERMYRRGIRHILIVGDLTDGCYKHGVFELTYSGIEDQVTELARMLPRKPGLCYHAISGNHDFTFSEKTGLDFGKYVVGRFAELGRKDITFYGDRAATLLIGGTSIRLLHPSGSCSYAVSYKLQKFVEGFDSGEKPGILLVGHYHRFCYIYTRGVHTFACPTFQGPGSAFGKSLGLGSQAMGGFILKWRTTKYKTLRQVSFEGLNYFKYEQAKEVND